MNANISFKRVTLAAILLVALVIVTACASARTPIPEPTAPAPTATAEPALTPTSVPLYRPVIAVNPAAGGPGTQVTVAGAGFPANAHVSVRLAPPNVGASSQSYGDTLTDANGAINMVIFAPSNWPDGKPITEEHLILLVTTDDFAAKATADFAF